MLAAPYLLFAGLCGLMYRAVRRARQELIAKQADSKKQDDADPPNSSEETT